MAKLGNRCLCWFPSAMLELIQVSTSMANVIQISIILGKTFLRISRIRNIPLTWILVRVFAYVPPFISQILDSLSIERFWFLFWSILNGVTLKTSNKSVTNTQANNNNNNNTLYLYDYNKVLQCCKSYLKLIIDSF